MTGDLWICCERVESKKRSTWRNSMTEPSDAEGTRPTHFPRPDLATLPLAPAVIEAGIWTRIFNRGNDPVFFNNRKGNRFTPTALTRFSTLQMKRGPVFLRRSETNST